MAKNSIKRKDVFFVDFETSKLLKKIEDSVSPEATRKALERAALRGLPLVEKEFRAFIEQHEYSGETAGTLQSASKVKPLWGNVARKRWQGFEKQGGRKLVTVGEPEDILFLEYGFDVNKGGLPSLFLDIGVWENGSPRQTPTFFIYYAVEKSLPQIHAMQKEELLKLVKELR